MKKFKSNTKIKQNQRINESKSHKHSIDKKFVNDTYTYITYTKQIMTNDNL